MARKKVKKNVPASRVPKRTTNSTESGDLVRIPDGEEIWEDFLAAYGKLPVDGLPDKERYAFHVRLLNWLAEEKLKIEKAMQPGLPAGEYDDLALNGVQVFGMPWVAVPVGAVNEMAKSIQRQEKAHFLPGPRMTERDEEVVRLRDQEQLDWDEITKRIRSNPAWATGQGGKKVSKRALMAAYSRRKKKRAVE